MPLYRDKPGLEILITTRNKTGIDFPERLYPLEKPRFSRYSRKASECCVEEISNLCEAYFTAQSKHQPNWAIVRGMPSAAMVGRQQT